MYIVLSLSSDSCTPTMNSPSNLRNLKCRLLGFVVFFTSSFTKVVFDM